MGKIKIAIRLNHIIDLIDSNITRFDSRAL